MGSSKAPAPTPPRETSAAATGTNVSTAIANNMMGNVNQITPQGTLTFSNTGKYDWTDPYTGHTYSIPTFTGEQKLSASEQAKYDQHTAAETNLASTAAQQSAFMRDYLGNRMNIDDLGPAPTMGQLRTGFDMPDMKEVQDAIMARAQPGLDQQRAALETKLSNQGIKVGTDTYLSAMRQTDQQQNDARLAAIMGAGQEQSRLAGLNQAQAGFYNNALTTQFGSSMDARRQGLQERTTMRNQPINEITALLSGSQVTQPSWINAQMSKIPTTDNAGIIANYDQNRLNAWNMEQQQKNSLMGGLMGGIANGLSAWRLSDETTKTDKKEVGKLKGHKLYEYAYKDDPTKARHVGVMAQEVEKKRPDAVRKGEDGKKRVNYGKLFAAGAPKSKMKRSG